MKCLTKAQQASLVGTMLTDHYNTFMRGQTNVLSGDFEMKVGQWVYDTFKVNLQAIQRFIPSYTEPSETPPSLMFRGIKLSLNPIARNPYEVKIIRWFNV